MSRALKVNVYNLYDTSSNVTDVLTDSLIYYGNTAGLPSNVNTGNIYLDTQLSTAVWRYTNSWWTFDISGNEVDFGTSKPATVKTGQIFLDISAGIPYWGNNGTWNTFTGQVATTFSPKSVSLLIGWFDAIDTNSVTVNASNIVTAFGDKVGFFNQTIVNGSPQYVTSGTVGGISNKKWIYFPGSAAIQGDIYGINSGVIRQFTLYIVGVNSGSAASARLFSTAVYRTTDTNTNISFGLNSTANGLTFVKTSQIYSITNDPSSNPFICGLTVKTISDVSNTLLATTYYNGTKLADVSENAGNLSGPLSFERFAIGCRYYQGDLTTNSLPTWIGYFGEVLLFMDPLSDAERQQIEGYLAWKWGMVSYLPAGHAYKSAAP